MRTVFLLLVAANLALFAWFQYYSPAESAADPEPARRQLNPEKIRLLEGKELKSLATIKPKPAATLAPARACIEWGAFALVEAPKAEQALAPLALGARLTQRRSEETAGWWVFIPPQANRAAAQKKTAELKTLGIEEFFILQDAGKMQWAVSLGVFSSEEAAKSRLEALRAKGVRSAQTGERDMQVAKIWFQLRNGDAAQQGRIARNGAGLSRHRPAGSASRRLACSMSAAWAALTYGDRAALHMLGDQREQAIGAHRLGEIAHRAELLAAVIAVLHRGQEDHRDVRQRGVGLERGDELEAVHVRHVDVGEDQVGRVLQHLVARADGVGRGAHFVTGRGEVHAQQLAQALVVIHHQDFRGHWSVLLAGLLHRLAPFRQFLRGFAHRRGSSARRANRRE
jgi:hypothetical protein